MATESRTIIELGHSRTRAPYRIDVQGAPLEVNSLHLFFSTRRAGVGYTGNYGCYLTTKDPLNLMQEWIADNVRTFADLEHASPFKLMTEYKRRITIDIAGQKFVLEGCFPSKLEQKLLYQDGTIWEVELHVDNV